MTFLSGMVKVRWTVNGTFIIFIYILAVKDVTSVSSVELLLLLKKLYQVFILTKLFR